MQGFRPREQSLCDSVSRCSHITPRKGLIVMPRTIPVVDANDACIRSFQQGYQLGREAAAADAAAIIAHLEHVADYWYFVANNPTAATEARRQLTSYIALREAREDAARQRARWDEEERALIEEARALVAAGKDDLAVALALGLFVPLVANIRAGAL